MDDKDIICYDENPENNLGAKIPDPWEDDDQTDWPNEEVPNGSPETGTGS